jgi:hypothetical protein
VKGDPGAFRADLDGIAELDVEVGDDEGLLGDPRVRAAELLREARAPAGSEGEGAVGTDPGAAIEPGGDEALGIHVRAIVPEAARRLQTN